MATSCVADPSSKPMAAWRSELARAKRDGAADDDQRVVECRNALAYWRVHQSIELVRGRLSPTGVDVLVAELLGMAR